MSNFAHLHLHTQYSLLDGAILMDKLGPAVLANGMKSVAMTDHGNMFGAVHFYKHAKAHGVKPIFGCEVYVAEGERTDRSKRASFHLVLLAKNEVGFRNLQFLVSKGYLEGFYYVPRIDLELLRNHSEGLIGLSACLAGPISRALIRRGKAAALEVAKEYQSIFEPGCFYLEVQPNGLTDQLKVNEDFPRIARELGLPLVATTDCHYLERQHSVAQEYLMAIQQGRTMKDEKRMRHESTEYYLKTPDEMARHFHDLPEALESAARIADQCHVELDLDQVYLPDFPAPEGLSQGAYLRQLAREGLDQRLRQAHAQGRKLDEEPYRERLELELGVIETMDYPGYFLIVQDFIRQAKRMGVPVGPGRGSGAGSLVAYSLDITDLDPLQYGLLFERFLNPERISMPDFDIDFCMHRRDEVLEYVVDRYGPDNVGQIVTFSTFKARGLVRDVARVMGLPYADGDAIAKLVPEGPKVTISGALDDAGRLRELYDKDEQVRQLLDIAKSLEGLNRHAGVHAAGVVISGNPLWERVPVIRAQDDGVIKVVTQYAKDEVEQAGLVKFDFLGLKTLTVIDEALRRINVSRKAAEEPPLDIKAIPMDDAGVYDMISRGETAGVFQLESEGFTKLLRKLRPDRFEDIVASVALYRPGPLQGGMVDQFIDCKHGRKPVVYPHPSLEEILAETYGVMVYQEQVMQTAQIMAGFTLGQADILRRAMGKKKVKELERQRSAFQDGAKERGIDPRIAAEVFELMFKFAEYGFNKSHSAAYGLITYQTAYLKHHYPVEFMAGLLSCERENSDGVVKYMAVAREMDIRVLPPDVNESEMDFSVVRRPDGGRKSIRFGLGAVKKVGTTAVEAILSERTEGGPYRTLFGLCERVDLRRVNRGVIEALVKAGAVDGITQEPAGLHRASVLEAVPTAVERGQRIQEDRRSGQTNLLDLFGAGADDPADDTFSEPTGSFPEVEQWTPRQLLEFEKESLGFYISGHPLDRYVDDMRNFTSHTMAALEQVDDRTEVTLGGIVAEYRERPLRSGNGHIAFFKLEDLTGKGEVMCRSRQLEEFGEILRADEPILLVGRMQRDGDDRSPGKVILAKAMALADARLERTSEVHLTLTAGQVDRDRLLRLKEILSAQRGDCPVFVHVVLPDHSETVMSLGEGLRVSPTEDLLLKTERLFGQKVAVLR